MRAQAAANVSPRLDLVTRRRWWRARSSNQQQTRVQRLQTPSRTYRRLAPRWVTAIQPSTRPTLSSKRPPVDCTPGSSRIEFTHSNASAPSPSTPEGSWPSTKACASLTRPLGELSSAANKRTSRLCAAAPASPTTASPVSPTTRRLSPRPTPAPFSSSRAKPTSLRPSASHRHSWRATKTGHLMTTTLQSTPGSHSASSHVPFHHSVRRRSSPPPRYVPRLPPPPR